MIDLNTVMLMFNIILLSSCDFSSQSIKTELKVLITLIMYY